MGVFLALGARICLFRPLFSGLFRLVSPGVEIAQSHIHIHSYPIDPIGLFEDAVASTKGASCFAVGMGTTNSWFACLAVGQSSPNREE